MLNLLFIHFPVIEIFVKNIYGRSTFLQAINNKFRLKKTFRNKNLNLTDNNKAFLYFCDELRHLGVKSGDILIVHSSSEFCTLIGLSPRKIIETLQELVGPEGTIAMPAIPIIKDDPKGIHRLNPDKYNDTLIYNVQRSPPWTGILPRQLMQMTGSIRSQHPLNTMVALGPHAEPMMRGNLLHTLAKPCGPDSSWDYCHRHGAHIIALNCDLAHSLTMVHLHEDKAGTDWPIAESKWYQKRNFKIIDRENSFYTQVLERKATWSMFFAERRLSYLIYKYGVACKYDSNDISMSYCSSEKLSELVKNQKNKFFPYWIPMSRFINYF
jgi:aminoglycoside 3-N-acetyltransferase